MSQISSAPKAKLFAVAKQGFFAHTALILYWANTVHRISLAITVSILRSPSLLLLRFFLRILSFGTRTAVERLRRRRPGRPRLRRGRRGEGLKAGECPGKDIVLLICGKLSESRFFLKKIQNARRKYANLFFIICSCGFEILQCAPGNNISPMFF